MKINTYIFGLLLFLFTGTFLGAQGVHFAHGTEFFPANIKSSQAPAASDAGIINNHYIRYIQFDGVLTERQRTELENQGLAFIGYVHAAAYLTVLPLDFDTKQLENYGAKSIMAIDPAWKIHHNLKERPFGDWAVHGNQIDVSIKIYASISLDEGVALAQKNGIAIVEKGTQNGYLLARIDQDKIETIAALPFIQWMEQKAEPGHKEDLNGRSLHRSNLLDSDHPLGKKYNGEGVNILVRDDGAVGPHIDFQGRLYNQDGVSSPTSGTHGDGVAGVIGSAGNLDPTKKGMAAGADIYVVNYTSQFQDGTLPLFLEDHVTITNTSYSNGCNDGYTIASQTVDNQIFDHPELMHVFSAGNSNGSDCGYGAGTQWGNITGGHKMAKNAIATANLRVDGVIETSSSRGPAHDGRIKPDISAHGTNQNSTDPNNGYQVFGGTSAAAPGIAGCLGQLTHAYKTINNVPDAPAALLKLAIMTTANDMGNTGPDFIFGWGHINNFKALKLIEENRYGNAAVAQNETNNHSISIPFGVKQAKLMIYWADPAANVDAARALINDLDITVTGPDGTIYRPWKLNPTPDAAILNTPAGTGRDSLNNMEQVSIINPGAGVYTLQVKGYEVPFGPQPYYLAWEFLNDKVQLTYPSGGESFVPGTKEWLRWDAYGNTTGFDVKYSTNNGATYTAISSVSNSTRMLEWTVPNVTSGKVKLVVVRGTTSDTTDFPINIAPQPTGLTVQKVCPDSATLKWTAVSDLTLKYDIFQLGEKYMELKGTSAAAATQLTIPVSDISQPTWFSIRTTKDDGLTGRRINAINWAGGLLGCPQDKDLTINNILSPLDAFIVNCGPVTRSVTATVKNDGNLAATGGTISYQLDNETPVTEVLPILQPGQSFDYTFTTPLLVAQNGNHTLNIYTSLTGELFVSNNSRSTGFSATVEPVPGNFSEAFETTGLPNGWTVGNPDGDITWKQVPQITGADGVPGKVMFLDHYSYDQRQQLDYLFLPPVDLSGQTNPFLTFNYTHAQYNSSYVERLRVEAFPNCDLTATPVVLWEKTDPALAVVTTTTFFTPDDASDWRSEEVSLQQFAGQTLTLRFTALNDYGNSTYLDNVTLEDRTAPVADFNAEPMTCTGSPVVFQAEPSPGSNNTFVWNFGTGASPATATGAGPHQVTYLSMGDQTVELQVSNGFGDDTAAQVISVGSAPDAAFTTAIAGNNVQFTNGGQVTDTWSWSFGDNSTSTSQNPEHIFAANGIYTVELSSSNSCGANTTSTEVEITAYPEASFTTGTTSGCEPLTVVFTNTASANTTGYFWEFPGGTPATSTEANPEVIYNEPGTHDVKLTVNNTYGSSAAVQQALIQVSPQPVPQFTATTDGYTLLLDNQSAFSDSYVWDFGDGNSANTALPAYTYSALGTYTITLTTTNGCGTATASQSVVITTAPTVNFGVANTTGCSPFTATFQNLASSNATDFVWEFPGGTPATSTDMNPVVVYANPGVYTATLSASNAFGTATITKTDYIQVNQAPVAAFSAATNGTTVTLENNSADATAYTWDFGDGNTSALAEPTHTYAADGTYLVILTATGDCGQAADTATVVIVTPPTANFAVTTTTGCAPFSVVPENLSSINVATYAWEFPGGTPATSTEAQPTVVYPAPGVYSVILTVTNAAGASTSTQQDIITVNTVPEADFGIFSNDYTVSFTNLTANANSYTWEFGDGNNSVEANPQYTYATSGIFPVQLTATNTCGSSTDQLDVMIGSFPSASFEVVGSASGCAPLTVQFNNISLGLIDSYEWTFEGGEPAVSTAVNPVVTYTQPGTYAVKLVAENYFGVDFKEISQFVTVTTVPAAQFTTVIQGAVVIFTNTTSGTGNTYLWDFGDGNTSTDENPVHTYTATDTFVVSLTVTNDCGTAITTQTFDITVIGTENLPDWISEAWISPNPNTGAFTLELSGVPQEQVMLTFLNALGQVVGQNTIPFGTGTVKKQLQFGNLPAGSYFLRVNAGIKTMVLRVTVL